MASVLQSPPSSPPPPADALAAPALAPAPAITVRDMSVCYRGLVKSSIRSSWSRFFNLTHVETFKALDSVSFEIPEGAIVGIVGRNGAGKSTLLRAIAGIFSPDSGTIDLHGHSVSLLSIGVGFNKKLSGRENIYLSGLLLGYTEAQVRAREDEIVEFSELGHFIDHPVRMYSSGMYSKLAFAITSTLETDITLIDEVLAVGDAQFRAKSYARMRQLIDAEKRTVLIVSHNASTIRSLCTQAIWLDKGHLVADGPAGPILDQLEARIGPRKAARPGRAKKGASPELFDQP